MFVRGANVKTLRHVSGSTDNNEEFHLYDCQLTTSNGKSQTTHFNGIYIVIKKAHLHKFQVRSQGSPKLKGIKFKKDDTYTDQKVYVEEEQSLTDDMKRYISFFKSKLQHPLYKRLYFSTVEDEVHFAIWYRNHPARKLKVISLDSVNHVYAYFMNEYDIVNELSHVTYN